MEQSQCQTCYTVAIQPILYVSRCHHHTGLEYQLDVLVWDFYPLSYLGLRIWQSCNLHLKQCMGCNVDQWFMGQVVCKLWILFSSGCLYVNVRASLFQLYLMKFWQVAGAWELRFVLLSVKICSFWSHQLNLYVFWDSWDSWLLDLLISTPRMQNWEFFFSFPCQSAAELLGCKPDIACYSKLLTGGVVPLGATLASESVFETFMGNSKVTNPSLATFTSR